MWEGPEKIFTVTEFQKQNLCWGFPWKFQPRQFYLRPAAISGRFKSTIEWCLPLLFIHNKLFPRAEIHPSAEDPHVSLYSTGVNRQWKKACGWSTTGHITICRQFQGKINYFCTATMIFRTKERKIRDHRKRGNRFGKLGSKNAWGYPLQLQL